MLYKTYIHVLFHLIRLTGEEDFCRLVDKEIYLAAQRAEQGKRLIQTEEEQIGSVSNLGCEYHRWWPTKDPTTDDPQDRLRVIIGPT